jgi:hypothetical protein
MLALSAEIACAQMQFRPGVDSGRGTSNEQKACRGDARRHCREVMQQGDMAVLLCLREHRSKISADCRAVLAKYGH